MTISFMVLGGPRSATTWMANLLSTDTTLCLHDPLLEHKLEHLERLQIPGKRMGVSDTALLLWHEWLLKHPAPKVFLWREPDEINASLRALGLREIDKAGHIHRVQQAGKMAAYPWQSVFHPATAAEICKTLDVPFCRQRFEELRKMNVQPQFSRLPVGREAAQELVRRLQKEIA